MEELVVGIDGSDHSRRALRWAATVARAADVPVRAVQAWSHSRTAARPGEPEPVRAAEIDEQTEQDLAALAADSLGRSIEVETKALRGPTAGAILDAVTPRSVLVLGSRGRGGFAGLLLGSVSQECVEYAPCVVVVVRDDRTLADGEVILVGNDGSEGARRAQEWADGLARVTGSELRAVHARQATTSKRRPRLRRRLRSRAARTGKASTRQVGDQIESHEMEGDPRDVLVSAARRFDAALTVVGRRGAGEPRWVLIGSTANHLVRHSPSNVAVVPGPDSPMPA